MILVLILLLLILLCVVPAFSYDIKGYRIGYGGGFYDRFLDIVNKNAPGVHTNTNAWYYSGKKYFDYVPVVYSGKMTRNGFGFYPGNSLKTNWGVMDNVFGITRVQFEAQTPFWCTEFTTMTAVPGSIRKAAYATLLYGNQLVCGWTWQSMHGGR